MAWQFPLSRSFTGIAVDLTTTDSAFIADGVLVASTGGHAISGTGSFHHVIITGAAVSDAAATVILGDEPAGDHDDSVTVEAGGEVRSFGGTAITLFGYHEQVTN